MIIELLARIKIMRTLTDYWIKRLFCSNIECHFLFLDSLLELVLVMMIDCCEHHLR